MQKKRKSVMDFLCGSGGRTRTSGLRVMSQTSYQLLYPAILDCKDTHVFRISKIIGIFAP